MHPQFALCTLFLVLHSSLTDMNVNSSKAMNPACRPHSKRRSAADSFGWPSNPSVGSSGSQRNSGCPPGRTWDAHQGKQPATGTRRGSQGMNMAAMTTQMFEAALYTLEWKRTFLGATQGPSWSLLFLYPGCHKNVTPDQNWRATSGKWVGVSAKLWMVSPPRIDHPLQTWFGVTLTKTLKNTFKHVPWSPRKWFCMEN